MNNFCLPIWAFAAEKMEDAVDFIVISHVGVLFCVSVLLRTGFSDSPKRQRCMYNKMNSKFQVYFKQVQM